MMPFLLKDSRQKLKLEKVSWYFNNSLLCKPDFSSAKKNLLLLKTQRSNHSSASDMWKWKYTKACFKENGRCFPKVQPLKEILEFKD